MLKTFNAPLWLIVRLLPDLPAVFAVLFLFYEIAPLPTSVCGVFMLLAKRASDHCWIGMCASVWYQHQNASRCVRGVKTRNPESRRLYFLVDARSLVAECPVLSFGRPVLWCILYVTRLIYNSNRLLDCCRIKYVRNINSFFSTFSRKFCLGDYVLCWLILFWPKIRTRFTHPQTHIESTIVPLTFVCYMNMKCYETRAAVGFQADTGETASGRTFEHKLNRRQNATNASLIQNRTQYSLHWKT